MYQHIQITQTILNNGTLSLRKKFHLLLSNQIISWKQLIREKNLNLQGNPSKNKYLMKTASSIKSFRETACTLKVIKNQNLANKVLNTMRYQTSKGLCKKISKSKKTTKIMKNGIRYFGLLLVVLLEDRSSHSAIKFLNDTTIV